MPVPAGGGDDPLVLFTQPELVLWAPSAGVNEATYNLVLELVTTAIRGEVGASRYDALTDLAPLKLLALDLGRRMLRNAAGMRSETRQLDDFSKTVTYASETLQPPDLTEADIERLWRVLGVRTAGAFTIRPAGTPDCSTGWAAYR
jgi:hypothetical protein